jgi:predicted nucleic acid-binding protein
VRQFLDTNFPTPWLFLDGRRYQSLVGELAASGVVGGAVYDALVAATALDVDATLVSADGRARSVYEAIGTVVEMIV